MLPIGGADMPVVISTLNAFTGLSAAAAGLALDNTALIVAGMLVGASGSILTKQMAEAMNRSIGNVFFSGLGAGGPTAAAVEGGTVRSTSAADVAIQLSYARLVVVVPGYGMAVAQAQRAVADLAAELEKRGVEVLYGIHPVAGRMPGHMNVLLAEADVPYDKLKEMDDINGEFGRTDVALVIGANDVTNPAARTVADSPIYGMPILDVDKAGSIIVLKRSMSSGFAGIDNPLFYDPKTALLFGDAKASVERDPQRDPQRLALLLLHPAVDREADQPGDEDRDVADAGDLLDHHHAARERLDGDDVAQPDAGERREAEVEQLHPRAVGIRVDLRREAAGLDRLDDHEEVGERPRHEREGGADRPQFVAGDDVVLEHVLDQRARGVEVEDRLEGRRPGLEVVAAGHGLDHQQHRRRGTEEQGGAGQPARAADGEHDEAEDRDAEDAEQRPAHVAALHERIEQDPGELRCEQDRGGFPSRERQHERQPRHRSGRHRHDSATRPARSRPTLRAMSRILRASLLALLALAAFAAPASAQSPTGLVINEIDYDQPSTDTAEYLEIRNNGAAPVNLDEYALRLVNGATDPAAEYRIVDLPAVDLGAGAHYVVAAIPRPSASATSMRTGPRPRT